MDIAIILKTPYFCGEVAEENVIYADGAYALKDKIGKKNILAVVGDFDSLKKMPKNENIIKLDKEKDFTDGEKAVRLAVEYGAKNIAIYGATGGKIEHVLGNIALLKIAKNLGVNAKIKDDGTIIELIDGVKELHIKSGATLSLIPYSEKCEFIGSKGLYYPLNNITLTNGDTRGISNIATDNDITISIKNGEALLVYSM